MRGDLSDVKLPNGYYKAFLELHIEQGPILEREKLPLGIVTKIAAPASLYVTIEGVSGHAGSVPMPDRRDALCGAAELILQSKTQRKRAARLTVSRRSECETSFPERSTVFRAG